LAGTDATTAGGAGVSGAVLKGKTGVELRYHSPEKFAKLSKKQKTEVSIVVVFGILNGGSVGGNSMLVGLMLKYLGD